MFESNETNFLFNTLKTKSFSDINEKIKYCFDEFREIDSSGITYKTFSTLLDSLFVNKHNTPYHMPMQWKIDLFRLFDINGDNIISFDEFCLMYNNWIKVILEPKNVLLVVDVQNDFISGSLSLNQCPAGHNGEDVIPVINDLIDSTPFDGVVYSMDWHPIDHISFFENLDKRKFTSIDSNTETDAHNEVKLYDTVIFEGPPQTVQKLWPTHCVQQTWGSELHTNLKIRSNSCLVYKGMQSNIDSYSAFWDNQKLSQTNLREQLECMSITDVYICGLATDVCVGFTAFDSIDYGYRTVIIEDASRGISNKDIEDIKSKLSESKVLFVNSSKVYDMVSGVDRRPETAYAFAFKHLNNQTKTVNTV